MLDFILMLVKYACLFQFPFACPVTLWVSIFIGRASVLIWLHFRNRRHLSRLGHKVLGRTSIETVIIDGKVKKWRGRMVGVDTARVLRLAQEARDGAMQRCGFKRDFLE